MCFRQGVGSRGARGPYGVYLGARLGYRCQIGFDHNSVDSASSGFAVMVSGLEGLALPQHSLGRISGRSLLGPPAQWNLVEFLILVFLGSDGVAMVSNLGS